MSNLCKFPISTFQDALSISNYVRETNPVAMKEEICLGSNRIVLVVQGEGSFSVDGGNLSFREGEVLFFFPSEKVFLAKGENIVYMYMDFRGMRADELLRRFLINANNRCFKGYEGLIPLWDESLLRASEKTLDLASESILLYTFSRIFAEFSSSNGVVAEIVKITEQEFADTELSLARIAERLAYNTKYLSHIFKEQMGVTYSRYLQSVRIKYAVILFDNGLDSVKNVSFLSGFSDPLYFSNVFKKHTGTSPKDYVKKNEQSQMTREC